MSGGQLLDSLELAKRIVEIAEDRQASDIVLLDIQPVSLVADYFVIGSGNSERQLSTLTRTITDTVKQESRRAPLHAASDSSSGWVLLDYGDVVVHLFTPAEREYYQLEELWSQAQPVLRIQ